jgi:hypothetical protein
MRQVDVVWNKWVEEVVEERGREIKMAYLRFRKRHDMP